MTWTLLSIIGTVGALQLLVDFDRSVRIAGLVKSELRHGQWWRLFTAPFLHGNLIHFIFNASALLGLGRLTEALAGRSRLATVFAASAIGGSVFSLFLMPHSISVGASGGLLGLIGFLLVLGYRRRSLLPPGFVRAFVINVALVVVMGIVAFSIIDNASHLGGFLCGATAAAIMVRPQGSLPLQSSRRSKVAGIVSFAGMICFAFFAACKMLGKF
jgi:membrane associated rhomboid family serine protease